VQKKQSKLTLPFFHSMVSNMLLKSYESGFISELIFLKLPNQVAFFGQLCCLRRQLSQRIINL